MGVAVASLSEALVPTAGDRGRRRSRLRIAQTARALPKPLQPYHLHQSLAVGCGSLRAGPATTPHQMGRPRLKGERLPNLSVVAEDPSTQWRSVVVARWYGAKGRSVEVVSNTALWYSTGLPAVPLRWVPVRDPKGEFKTQVLLCTDLGAQPERIISWFVRRLSDGSNLSRGAPAPGVRDSEAMVREGYRARRSGAVGPFLPGDARRPPTNCPRRLAHNPPSGLVRQIPSDVHGCVGAGTQGAMELHYF